MSVAVLEREEVAVTTEVRVPVALNNPPPVEAPTRSVKPPRYRRGVYWNDLPLTHPSWARLDQLRQKAWDRGIEGFARMEYGYCPNQVVAQIRDIEAWLTVHPA